MASAYISVGSNIEPVKHIRDSLLKLKTIYGGLTLSSVYETQAVGFEGNNFYNLVVQLQTIELPENINITLRKIEDDNQRQRTKNPFISRTLDLDLLLYDEWIIKNGHFKLPRDEILKYAFVLCPLAEIAPTVKHPIIQKTYADLWQAFDKKTQPLWHVDIDFMSLLNN
jgi:2-amino-4-hydroxy-6-hydroxymethyldihydropteridine diphosphokinase